MLTSARNHIQGFLNHLLREEVGQLTTQDGQLAAGVNEVCIGKAVFGLPEVRHGALFRGASTERLITASSAQCQGQVRFRHIGDGRIWIRKPPWGRIGSRKIRHSRSRPIALFEAASGRRATKKEEIEEVKAVLDRRT